MAKWETAAEILGSIEQPEEGCLVYIAGVYWVHIGGKWRTFDNIKDTAVSGTTLEELVKAGKGRV